MARTLQPSPGTLQRLARHLRRGGLVAVPTETVYGLAADALNAKACAAIFEAKGRPRTDPLIVHVAVPGDAHELAEFNDAARAVVAAFWPGPLTVVLPRKKCVPDIVTAGGETVALRCPAHPVMRRLLRLTGRPLAAPSANPFGYISPTTAAHVAAGLGDEIPFILDGGRCRVGVESTILDLTHPTRPRILRAGKVTPAEIQRVLRRPVEGVQRRGSSRHRQAAPGMLTQHYSPRTPLVLHARIRAAALRAAGAREGFLLFRKPSLRSAAGARVFVLAPRGGTEEAARRLYAGLHELDGLGFDVIHAELAPARGAGTAINDRLQRAAAKRRAH